MTQEKTKDKNNQHKCAGMKFQKDKEQDTGEDSATGQMGLRQTKVTTTSVVVNDSVLPSGKTKEEIEKSIKKNQKVKGMGIFTRKVKRRRRKSWWW